MKKKKSKWIKKSTHASWERVKEKNEEDRKRNNSNYVYVIFIRETDNFILHTSKVQWTKPKEWQL